jgi:hypothetical protein
MEAQALKDDDIKLSIEAALARRHEKFAISYLSWTAHGYTLKIVNRQWPYGVDWRLPSIGLPWATRIGVRASWHLALPPRGTPESHDE